MSEKTKEVPQLADATYAHTLVIKSTHEYKFLSSGQYGLCFGYFFSGPLPLRSHFDSPPFGVCFRESLIFRLHSEIDQIHLSIEAQCGTACLPTGDCHMQSVCMQGALAIL